jgi:UDP-N-acetylglucosamine 2-epimerase (non-hydrolysing)
VTQAVPSVHVVGTRAQLIKVAPVIVACEERGLPVRLLLTGQHQETMQDLLQEFGIRTPPEAVVPASERATVLSLVAWVPRVLAGLWRILRAVKRDHPGARVLVHGDTLSSVLGAAVARACGLPVYHLESGLTSGRLLDPFPEELSRRMVFHLSQVALCPGAAPAEHMRRHYRCQVVDTGGNTIEDSVATAMRRAPAAGVAGGPAYVVASLHRFQNLFDVARLRGLVDLLVELSRRYPIHFVLHPATRKRLQAEGLLAKLEAQPGIRLSPRLGYAAFLSLASRAACVLTDGGSNQEELAVLGVPTVVMRQATERQDGLGANAIMEADLQPSPADYLLAGRFEQLRRPSRVATQYGPSALIADLLAT